MAISAIWYHRSTSRQLVPDLTAFVGTEENSVQKAGIEAFIIRDLLYITSDAMKTSRVEPSTCELDN